MAFTFTAYCLYKTENLKRCTSIFSEQSMTQSHIALYLKQRHWRSFRITRGGGGGKGDPPLTWRYVFWSPLENFKIVYFLLNYTFFFVIPPSAKNRAHVWLEVFQNCTYSFRCIHQRDAICQFSLADNQPPNVFASFSDAFHHCYHPLSPPHPHLSRRIQETAFGNDTRTDVTSFSFSCKCRMQNSTLNIDNSICNAYVTFLAAYIAKLCGKMQRYFFPLLRIFALGFEV